MTQNCKNCNKEFDAYRKSKQHCSQKCFDEYRRRPDVQKKLLEKSRQTKLEKYGNANYTNRNKAKQTCLEKYGTDNAAKSDKIKEKAKQTNLDRYGVEYIQQNEDFKEKTKQTCLEKYGVDNVAKSNEIKEKTKQTCLEKYGVVSPTLVTEIYNKQKQTKLEKYDDENYNNKEKTKQTCLEKYGVDVPLKNKKIYEKLKKTNLERYGTTVSTKCNIVKKKIKETNLKKFGSVSAMGNNILKEKCICSRLKNHFNAVILISEKYSNVIPLFKDDEYKGNGNSSEIKYPFKCKTCNTDFNDTLLSGNIPRCPICFPKESSKPQQELYNYISAILPDTTEIQNNTRKIIPPLELDIYIPSKKLAIEFNGLYWHSDISGKKYKNYHINKTIKCKENGIRLIHIFEDEWIEKQEIIKNKLKHVLGLNSSNKVHARKCIIKEIDTITCNTFLNKYHIQGEDRSNIRMGLFDKDGLVSVMTFGKLRVALGNTSKQNEYEMYRFVTSKTIVGAGGKLLSYFIKTYEPVKIISYADRRWSEDNAFYNKIGFKFVKLTTPNYWYVDNSYMHRYYRYNFVKHTLKDKLKIFDPLLTEWQNMQINGYDRIWDCGHLKYEMSVT